MELLSKGLASPVDLTSQAAYKEVMPNQKSKLPDILRVLRANDVSLKVACGLVGINPSTLNAWRKTDPDIDRQVREILDAR